MKRVSFVKTPDRIKKQIKRAFVFAIGLRRILRFAIAVWLVAATSTAFPQAHSPFEMLDSGFPAEDAFPVAWVDNYRVLFTGVELGTRREHANQRGYYRGLKNAAYVWNTAKSVVTKYRDTTLGNLCTNGTYISYRIVESWEAKKIAVFAGKFGSERRLTLGNTYWFNSISCRYFADPPVWAKRRMDGRFIQPLIDQDGYIDYGPSDLRKTSPTEIRNTPPTFWFADGKKSRTLNIEARYRENRPLRFTYAPFADEYFARASTSVSSNVEPAFYLSRKGELRKVDLPKGPWGGWHYFAVRPGIFVIGGVRRSFSEPGDAGGYLFTKERVTKVVTGNPRQVSVSPDGCKVAFVYTWSQQAQTDGYKAWKEGKVANTVRMIDLCRPELTR